MRRQGFVVWLTGLPSAGKTTLARLLHQALDEVGFPVEVLDGDEVRQRLTKGLSFSKEDREENISRIGYVAKLLARVGAVAVVAAISPYRESRDRIRVEIGNIVEVYVRCPLNVCMQRDGKGLYAKALRGEIANFTGVSDPYEPPLNPEVVVETDRESPEESFRKILEKLGDLRHVPDDVLQRLLKDGGTSRGDRRGGDTRAAQWSV